MADTVKKSLGLDNGEKLTVDELYEKVKMDNIYFLSTGGGIVFGGGEPLLHSKFIKEFIEKYNNTGWKFGLETSLSTKKRKSGRINRLY